MPYGIILDCNVGLVYSCPALCYAVPFCLTVISLKASEDSSFEKKKKTWAFFEGKACIVLL